MFIPRNETLSTTSMIVSSGIATVRCGCRNTIHFDLFTFIDNLFNFNHNNSFFYSPFIIFLSYRSKSTISFVSSANKIKNNLSLHYTKLFTYIRNNSGPSIDPCGTPVFIPSKLESVSSSETYCCL